MTTHLDSGHDASHAVQGDSEQPLEGVPVLEAQGASVRGARGEVFGPLYAISRAPITIVLGNRGSGRTSFLLSAAGRMRIDRGSVKVCGIDARSHAAQVRRLTGIAGFNAIDQLEAGATVSESIRERLTWNSPWYRRVPHLAQAEVATALRPVFGDMPAPAANALVRDISEAQELLLRIGLARLEEPRVILVDDLDDVKDPSERAAVAHRISVLAQHGTLFILGSADERDLNLFSPESSAVIALGR